jgi:predicted AAA+ superfamily ATPase
VLRADLTARLRHAAAVALLGPRQIGKTMVARDIANQWEAGVVYLDLERPAGQRRLEDAETLLTAQVDTTPANVKRSRLSVSRLTC